MHLPIVELDTRDAVHMHHTESVDPTLAQWINTLLHDLLGWGPWTFVVVLGIAIAAIPVWLIYSALRHLGAHEESDDSNE